MDGSSTFYILSLILCSFCILHRCTAVPSTTRSPVTDGISTVTVQEGYTALLPCSNTFGASTNIIWIDKNQKILTFNDIRLVNNPRYRIEHPSRKEWNLHIIGVTKEDEGLYTCQLYTEPVTKFKVQLVVTSAVPSTTRSPVTDGISTVTVQEGDTALLPCSNTSCASTNIIWMDENRIILTFNDTRLVSHPRYTIEHPSKKEWNLLIKGVTKEDEGVYTCQLDTEPVTNFKVQLVVTSAPVCDMPALQRCTEKMFSLTSVDPDMKQLCRLLPEVKECLSRVTEGCPEQVVNSINQGLHLMDARCKAVPSTTRSPVTDGISTVTVQEGDTALLPCSNTSCASTNIIWMDENRIILTFNDTRLVSHPRYTIEHPSKKEWNLHIKGVTKEDEGVYTCQLDTEPVTNFKVQLVVTSASAPVCDMQAVERCTEKLSSLTSVVPDMKRSCRILSEVKECFSRVTEGCPEQFIYSINQMLPETDVLCKVVPSSTQPPVTDRTSTVTVQEGDTAILPCNNTFDSAKIIWAYEDNTLLTVNDRRFIDDPRYTIERPFQKEWNLRITEVKKEDEGLYICQLDTELVTMFKVQLVVTSESRNGSTEVKKSITINGPESVSVGANFSLDCVVKGFSSEVIIDWFKDGALLRQNFTDRYMISNNGSRLTFPASQIIDSGTYVCRSMDKTKAFLASMKVQVGNIEKNNRKNMERKTDGEQKRYSQPDGPVAAPAKFKSLSLRAIALSSSSILVSAVGPYGTQVLNIRYSNGGKRWTKVKIDADKHYALVEGLYPSTRYFFMAKARVAGKRKKAVTHAVTFPGLPSVENITVEQNPLNGSARLFWEYSEDYTAVGFVIRVDKTIDGEYEAFRSYTVFNATSFTLEDVEENFEYKVKIIPFDYDRVGNESDGIIFRMNPSKFRPSRSG